MPAARRLLTGPHGAGGAVREHLLGLSGPGSLWLVPTRLARAQVLADLGRSAPAGRAPRVWCWYDLWRAVREGRDDGPVKLSAAAARAALGLAIDRARADGALGETAGAARWPGFRRRVRDRIAGWTRLGLNPDHDPPGSDDPAVAAEWSLFRSYRDVLRGLDAEDAEGFAVWAAGALAGKPPAALRKLGAVVVLEPEADAPAVSRALTYFEARAKVVHVAIAYDPDPALADAFADAVPTRARLLERGYEETTFAPDLWRPPCLRDVERELFRPDAHARPPIRDAAGLALLGAPQGDGLGLVVAREVRGCLCDDGAAPEDVLVLVRGWDDDAEAVLGVLRSWGLPVSAVGRPRAWKTEPAVSALRRALRVPVGGFEAAEVVRLLRSGRFRPDWPEARAPEVAARAAAAVRDAGVFAGRDAILSSLARAADAAPGGDPAARAARAAVRMLVSRLFTELAAVDRPGTWAQHAARLRRLAAALGFADAALERLFDALDDHAAVLDPAGDGAPVRVSAFADALDALADDLVETDDEPAPGSVVVATVDGALGARARFVVLANLAEGTFPTRAAVDAAGTGGPEGGRAIAREMSRFLRVVGAAGERLTLAYPTRDEKGQEVLPPGFLDDLTRSLDPSVLAGARQAFTLLDPALTEHADLAVSPADARARAVALASAHRQPGDLARLASDPRHRAPLEGAAAALLLTADRLAPRRPFSNYDGLLSDPDAVAAVAARYGPEAVFSPSMFESYLTCPYQFFLKYLLTLKPVDDRDDLDEDYAGRGDRLHRLLELLELRLKQEGGDRLAVAEVVIRTEMGVELTVTSDADPGLNAIERRRVEKALRQYTRQMRDYEAKSRELAPRPSHFEVSFGPDAGTPHPCLVIGEGANSVRIQGKIDRVDVVETPDGTRFRVIDYKTGVCPTVESVRKLVMVQLPLYALAVERLALVGDGAGLQDLGYWALRDAGYKLVKLGEWSAERERLEDRVLEAAGRLRSGLFVIQPEKPDCDRTCDFPTVCRIGQVRRVEKAVPQTGGRVRP